MAYKWAGRQFGVSADIVGRKLKEIEETKGSIQREDVVEIARPENSELHKLFEWNDKKAANEYRLIQAGNIIRCLVVTIDNDGKQIESRAFMNIEEKADIGQRKNGLYVNVQTAFENNKELLLNCALRELKIFQKKYARLTELSAIFESIDNLEKR